MKKNYTIILRVSAEDKKLLQEKAKKCGMSVSQLLRFLGLRVNIREINGYV